LLNYFLAIFKLSRPGASETKTRKNGSRDESPDSITGVRPAYSFSQCNVTRPPHFCVLPNVPQVWISPPPLIAGGCRKYEARRRRERKSSKLTPRSCSAPFSRGEARGPPPGLSCSPSRFDHHLDPLQQDFRGSVQTSATAT